MSNQTPTLDVKKREQLGTRYSARLRKAGQLPAVIYGHQQDPEHVAIDTEAFLHELDNGAHLITLNVDGGKEENCILKDLQYDHLGTTIIHADFARVDLNEEVTVNVSIEITGKDESVGLKASGARLDQKATDLEVSCLATAIPESIVVDITNLEAGSNLLAGQVPLPEGVKLVTNDDTPVVSIVVKSTGAQAAEEEADGEAASAEPEVITEKKDDE